MLIRLLTRADLDQIRQLAALAETEGHRFLHRLVRELEDESAHLETSDEFFLAVLDGARIVGVGGVTRDPYLRQPGIGRVRHVYVHPERRRAGIGQTLIRELEGRAGRAYAVLRLRTDTPDSARFYEALGYWPVSESTATHIRVMANSTSTPSTGMPNNRM